MLFIIVVCITVRVMEFLNLQCWVHYWFNWPANNLYFVLFTFFTVWAGFSLQAVETTYSKLLNKIPSDNSSLWDRNNKTHCLAVVKRDIHHVGAWQQWLVGVLFWLNTEPIKCYSLTSYTERDSNNPLDQSKVLSKLLRLFFYHLCSHYSITVEKGHEGWEYRNVCDMTQRLCAEFGVSVKWAAGKPPQIRDCNLVTSCSALYKGYLVKL